MYVIQNGQLDIYDTTTDKLQKTQVDIIGQAVDVLRWIEGSLVLAISFQPLALSLQLAASVSEIPTAAKRRKECSPRRKPWVNVGQRPKPRRAKSRRRCIIATTAWKTTSGEVQKSES